MNHRLVYAVSRVALIVASVVLGFLLLHDRARIFEADAAVAVLRALGADVASLSDHSILVRPEGGELFRVVVTPACSSITAVLSVLALGMLMPSASRPRRVLAVMAALATVILGNLLRIVLSLAAGLVDSRTGLVLFHDSIGSIFTFASILAGYMVMLWVLLPDRRSDERAATDQSPVLGHV